LTGSEFPKPIDMSESVSIPAAPVSQKERIVILDSLRGIAILGILLMNIPWFAFSRNIVSSPNLTDFTGANYYTWYGVEWVLEGTQRALFSALFGAGILLFINRLSQRAKGLMPAEYFFRRNLWLLVFGLFNAYVLLWPGDILFHYAILGMMLFAFRRLKPKYLLVAAFICLLLQTLRENADFYRDKALIHQGEMIARVDTSQTKLSPPQKENFQEYQEFKKNNTIEAKKKNMERISQRMQGSYSSVYRQQSEFAFRMETTGMFYLAFFDVLLFMFVGMAFYKNGLLLGRAPATTYWVLFVIGLGTGLVLSYLRLQPLLKYNFDNYAYTKNVWFQFYGISRVFRALGVFGAIMLLYKSGAFKWLFSLMRPVGQMAFTNYLSQSVLCGLFFYGIGFGYFGKLQYHQMYYVVIVVWVIEIVWSHIWLRYFQFGPMEWLWRSLTYWKKQPLKKEKKTEAALETLMVEA
jgi:uncharacterized protein